LSHRRGSTKSLLSLAVEPSARLNQKPIGSGLDADPVEPSARLNQKPIGSEFDANPVETSAIFSIHNFPIAVSLYIRLKS